MPHGVKGRTGRVLDILGARGAVLWEGRSAFDNAQIVVIGTAFVPAGAIANSKTGDAIQTWILLRDVKPSRAIRTKEDKAICGSCKMRPLGKYSSLRACYVNLVFADKVWETYQNGGYGYYPWGEIEDEQTLTGGRSIRLGAYGDPAVVPHTMWEELTKHSDGWFGYTHLWRTCPARFKQICMASVDSPEEREEAKDDKWPWRTYRTRFPEEPLLPGEIMCPASPEFFRTRLLAGKGPKKIQCEDCFLCNGARYKKKSRNVFPDGRADISIIVHGFTPNITAYPYARGLLPVLN